MACHLYSLTFANGKQYIGKTNNIRERKSGHLYDAQTSERLVARAWRKHGQPIFQHLAVVEDYMIDETEIKAIAAYGTLMPNGYNMTIGGDGILGYSHTPSAKSAISKSSKQRWQDVDYKASLSVKIKAAMTDESKQSRSAILKEQRASKEYRERMSERALIALNRPEYKAAASERARLQWANPGTRQTLLAARSTRRIKNA